MAQMKVQNVRFGAYQWNAILRAAEQEGVSAAQFIRETAFARAVLVLYLAGDRRVAFASALANALAQHPELDGLLREVFATTDNGDG